MATNLCDSGIVSAWLTMYNVKKPHGILGRT